MGVVVRVPGLVGVRAVVPVSTVVIVAVLVILLQVSLMVVSVNVRLPVVLVDVGVHDPGLLPRDVGDDLEATVLHPARREHALGGFFQHVRRAAHDDDLEAVVVVEVHVHRGANGVPEAVLELGQPLGEVADVVVVHEGEGSDGGLAFSHLLLGNLGPNEVAEDLGACRPARLDDRVELGQEGVFHGDAKADEHVFHRGVAS